jgi:hypothetical protein
MGFLGHHWYANFMSTLWYEWQEQVTYHTNLISWGKFYDVAKVVIIHMKI